MTPFFVSDVGKSVPEFTVEIDNRASIAWYTKAAAQGEHNAELALSGWYLTGAEGMLEQSDMEAYLWARKAAQSEPPLAKAMFAMGYFTEQGIGCPKSLEEAKRWYGRAACKSFLTALVWTIACVLTDFLFSFPISTGCGAVGGIAQGWQEQERAAGQADARQEEGRRELRCNVEKLIELLDALSIMFVVTGQVATGIRGGAGRARNEFTFSNNDASRPLPSTSTDQAILEHPGK